MGTSHFKFARKLLFVMGMVCLCLLSACSYEQSNYDDGYDDGYADGVEYVLSTLRDNAYGGNEYIVLDDVADKVCEFCEEYQFVSENLMLDYVVYNKDVDIYYIDEILEDIIRSCIDE